MWFELNRNNEHLNFNDEKGSTWWKITKGGDYRKWYGNLSYVCLWKDNGTVLKSFSKATVSNSELFFTTAISWTYITSGKFSMRELESDVLYNNKGPACYCKQEYQHYLLALTNSVVSKEILSFLAPTIDCKPGNLTNIPVIINNKAEVDLFSKNNVDLSILDWNSNETSWNFKKNPLV